VILYGAAYYPEHREPGKWDHDLDTMAGMGVNALRVGEFAWKRFEPAEGQYDFGWMDAFGDKAHQRGIGLVLCPPLRTLPAWLVEKDPSLLIEDAAGRRLAYGSRYTFCINHPLLRERGFALAERMAEHYAAADYLLGWHLDNEPGDEPDCHCPRCVEAWQAWLQRRYGDVETLNRAWGLVFWGLEFDSFAQVPTPRMTKASANPGHLQAWRQFRSNCTVEVLTAHAEALRRHSPDRFISTNFQNVWNTRTDYYRAAEPLDFCGLNYYPPFGENRADQQFGLAATRSYKDRPFHIYELRNGPHAVPGRGGNTPSPGEVERLTMHAIGNGADGIFYFRWRAVPFGPEQNHGTITDYDGRPNRIYRELKPVGAKLRRIAELLDGTTVRSDVAVLYDFPTRWMTGTGCGWEMPADLYVRRAATLHAAVRSLGVNCDAVGREQGFDRYRILLVPLLAGMTDELAEKLRRYVEAGGMLVWHPLSGTRNADAEIYLTRFHPVISELLGIRVRDWATAGPDEKHELTWRGKRYPAGTFFELPELDRAEPVAQYADGWFAGTPAVTVHRAGEGRAFHVATFAEEPFYRALLAEYFEEFGLEPLLDAEVPDGVEVVQRSADDGRKLLFLLNGSDEKKTLRLEASLEDVWNAETVSGDVPLGPQQVRALRSPNP
jgi:beta-galactosidase